MTTEWKKVRLGELYEVHNGLSKGGKFFGSGYPFLSFSTIFNNFFIPENIKDLVQSTPEEQENYSVKAGDVFVTRTSETADELGMSCVALKDYPNATYNGFCKRLRPIDTEYTVLPKYIGYYLRTPEFRGKFLGLSGSMTTRASLKNDDLLSMTIPLPPLETQQKIAGILSAYDDLIENNRKQIKLLEEATQKLYKEWFVKLNFPGHENVKIVDDVPEGWQFERIDSFIELLNGFAFKSDSFDDEGKYGIITIKNVQDGAFDSANVNRVKEVPSKMPDWCNLEIGDILLSLTGNVGRVCLVTSEKCLLNQRVAKLKSDYPSYTYTLFRSKDMFIMMNNLANGAAQQNLSPIRTGEQKILKPTNEIISAFEGLLSPFIKRELSLFIQIQLLQSARDKLLPKLMNGNFY